MPLEGPSNSDSMTLLLGTGQHPAPVWMAAVALVKHLFPLLFTQKRNKAIEPDTLEQDKV